MDFLRANEAVVNLQSSTVTFSTKGAIDKSDPAEVEVLALRLVDDDVIVLPRSSAVVSVIADCSENCERLVEVNINLLLEREICVARGLVYLHDACANVLLTNFGNEVQHVAKGTAIASLHEFVQSDDPYALEAEGCKTSDPKNVLELVHINPHFRQTRNRN